MALRVKGLDFRVHNVRSPMEARRFNPRGRVPALLIDGETIVDSTDIVTALDARFPGAPLTPTDPLERAQATVLELRAETLKGRSEGALFRSRRRRIPPCPRPGGRRR
jgi:glutathione S-transferase